MGRSLREVINRVESKEVGSFFDFMGSHIHVGQPNSHLWSTAGHEHLEGIVREIDRLICDLRQAVVRHIAIEKAAQAGVSSIGIGLGCYLPLQGYKGAYILPTRAKMQDFVQDRFDPMIDEDEYLLRRVVEGKIVDSGLHRKGKSPADNMRLKHIGQGSLLCLGLQKIDEAKSYPLDFVIPDEVSELPQKYLDFLDDRMMHSTLKLRFEFSQPDIPMLGIDESFQDSDQRYWKIRCRRCRVWTALELAWPNVLRKNASGEWLIGCPSCDAPLHLADGEWVALYPGRDIIGFHITQLLGAHISAAEVAKKWEKAQRRPSLMANFMISWLGFPYAGDRQPLSRELLLSRVGDWGISPSGIGLNLPQGTAYAGLDVGDILHLVIRRRFSDGISRVVWAEKTPDWGLVRKRLQDHKVAAFCVDAMPYKTTAKDLVFVLKNGVIVYSSAKSTHYGMEDYYESPNLRDAAGRSVVYQVPFVNVNRTEMVDRLVDEVSSGYFWLPAGKLSETAEMMDHFGMLVKDKKDDGSYSYRRGAIKNHYGFAAALSLQAEEAGAAVSLAPPRPLGDPKNHLVGKPIAPRRW